MSRGAALRGDTQRAQLIYKERHHKISKSTSRIQQYIELSYTLFPLTIVYNIYWNNVLLLLAADGWQKAGKLNVCRPCLDFTLNFHPEFDKQNS